MGGVVLPLSFLPWGDLALGSIGSKAGLVVASNRTYAKGPLPGLRLPAPLSSRWAASDPHLHRRPSSTRSASVFCVATAPFSWVLVCVRFCLCPLRMLKWVKVAQLCLTLCDPMDYTVQEIFQARVLEWVAYPFSSRSSWPRNWTGVSCIAGGFFTSWLPGKSFVPWVSSSTIFFCPMSWL